MVAEWFSPLCEWLGLGITGLLLLACFIVLLLILVRG